MRDNSRQRLSLLLSIIIISQIFAVSLLGNVYAVNSCIISSTGASTITSGGYTYYWWTSGSGTFHVTSGSCTTQILVIAGGGSGGFTTGGTAGAGGGAGGILYNSNSVITPSNGTITVTVGNGGAEKTTNGNGNDGQDSFFGALKAFGGGGGHGFISTYGAGDNGGSGGGSENSASVSSSTQTSNNGGTGFGNAGGQGGTVTNIWGGGGGGGSGAVGGNGGGTPSGGAGGNGLNTWSTWATATSTGVGGYYAGGGGGGTYGQEGGGCGCSSGGLGGGGQGGSGATGSGGVNGHDATGQGSGGGGSGAYNLSPTHSGAGSSGLVIVRYLTPTPPTTPTLTHANMLNTTAIQLDWGSVTGAVYYLINYTSPASGTTWTQLNVTTISKVINNLLHGTQYAFKVASGNSSGVSSFSSIKSNYTINTMPTGVSITNIHQTTARILFTPPTDNSSGTKIEKSTNGGTSWSTVVSNTGNLTGHYDLIGLSPATTYLIRLSQLYAVGTNHTGTSATTTPVSFITYGNTANIRIMDSANSTALTSGTVRNTNSSTSGTRSVNSTGWVVFNADLYGNQNVTDIDTSFGSNLVTGKHFNVSLNNNVTKTYADNKFYLHCASGSGSATDVILIMNDTNGARQTWSQSPTCDANHVISGIPVETGNGNDLTNYTSIFMIKIVNSTFTGVSSASYGGTAVPTSYSSPYVTSSAFSVGTGTQTVIKSLSITLDTSTPTPTPTPTPSGGGSGGTGPFPSLSTVDTSGGTGIITYSFQKDQLIIGQSKNEVIHVEWNGKDPLQINAYSLGNEKTPLGIKFNPEPPYTFEAKSDKNVGDMTFIVSVPETYCSATVLINCLDPTLNTITIPITIEALYQNSIVRQSTNLVFTVTKTQELASNTITGLVIFAVVGMTVGSAGIHFHLKSKAIQNKEKQLKKLIKGSKKDKSGLPKSFKKFK